MRPAKKTQSSVDGFIRKHKQWQGELAKLRAIALGCGLTEDMKWRVPCYTFENKNVVLVGVAKEYCALSFMKGVLLKDPNGILEQPGQNTRAARMIRFTNSMEIGKLRSVLEAYINEAIELEKSGLKVDFKKDAQLEIPEELQWKFDEDRAFDEAFNALTLGRQRGYILYFSAAKQSKTRTSRIEKYEQLIFEGKGMLDDYAKKKRGK